MSINQMFTTVTSSSKYMCYVLICMSGVGCVPASINTANPTCTDTQETQIVFQALLNTNCSHHFIQTHALTVSCEQLLAHYSLRENSFLSWSPIACLLKEVCLVVVHALLWTKGHSKRALTKLPNFRKLVACLKEEGIGSLKKKLVLSKLLNKDSASDQTNWFI